MWCVYAGETSPKRLIKGGSSYVICGGLRHDRRLTPYRTMQNKLAGTKPHCEVLTPMMQMMTLFMAASPQPSQHLRPTRIVESTVSPQDK
jgi:hypothetical protein